MSDTKYRLKKNQYFMCGVTAFALTEGAVVTVKQVNLENDQALIDFGGGLTEWKPRRILSELFEEVANEKPTIHS